MKNLLLLGCGNMAKALISSTWFEAYSIDVYAPNIASSSQFCSNIGGRQLLKLDLSKKYDYVFLAFKPQQLEDVVELMQPFDLSQSSILSILASIESSDLADKLNISNVLRVMPNTPAQVGAGTLTYFIKGDKSKWNTILDLFSQSSTIIECLKESEIDASTPVTGSGPAFIFELGRIWEGFLIEQGFNQKKASDMVKSTLFGSSLLMKESSLSFEELRNQVTSKAGITERGLNTLESSDFEKIIIQSLTDCLTRIEELKQ